MSREKVDGHALGPIFIGGDGRSGTTLVSVVLNAHPDLAVGPELHFRGPRDLGPYVVRCLELLLVDDPRTRGKGLKENPELRAGVQFAKRCARFGLSFEQQLKAVRGVMEEQGDEIASFESRARLISLLGETAADRKGASQWGIKIMRDIGAAKKYAKEWPSGRFLHVVRDGRDVAASQMREHGTWGYSDIEEAAKAWVKLLDTVDAQSRRVPIHQFSYESLVDQPGLTLEGICEFLEIGWSELMLRHVEVEQPLFDEPYGHPSATAAAQPINPSSIGRFRRDLSAEEIRTFEGIAGQKLIDLDYELSG